MPASLLACVESGRLLGRGFPRLPSDMSLDAALDLRDAGPFDDRWMAAHGAIVALEKNSPAAAKEHAAAARIGELAFMRAFESSSSPDFAGYVSDDFDLLSRALLVGYDSPWLTALFNAYSENRFPHGTLSETTASLHDSIDKMKEFPEDIYTEPEPDSDTLANLGPLTGMAGIWTSAHGLDTSPKPEGPEKQVYIEHVELQPIDAQANGPQLFYGLRYHTRIVKPGEVETFHNQVGFWLWEPATGTVIQTLAIPRGQIAMAVGHAAPDAKSFRLEAVRGSETNGIVSNPFLEYAFKTMSYTIDISINADGTWSYQQDTVLVIPGQKEPFHHTDRNTLRKIAEPTPNPTALAAAGGSSATEP